MTVVAFNLLFRYFVCISVSKVLSFSPDSSYRPCYHYGVTYTCLKLYRSGSKYQYGTITGYVTLGGVKIRVNAYLGRVHLPYMNVNEEIDGKLTEKLPGVLAAEDPKEQPEPSERKNEDFDRSTNNYRTFDHMTDTPHDFEALPDKAARVALLIKGEKESGFAMADEALKSADYEVEPRDRIVLEQQREPRDDIINPATAYNVSFDGMRK